MAITLENLDQLMPAELVTVLEGYVNPPSYGDTSGTPGSGTSNTVTGRSAIALGASAATITCNKCTTTSVVHLTMEDLDATATLAKVVPGAGSFVVTTNANATAATKFRWSIAGAR